MRYQCPSCNRVTVEEICSHCGVPTVAVSEKEPEPRGEPPVEEPPVEEPLIAEPSVEEPPEIPEAPPPAESTPSEPAAAAAPAIPMPQAGQQQLEEYLQEGYEVFLIAGIAAAGKTQLLDAYRQDAYLAGQIKKRRGHALPTSPGTLDCHPVSVGRRKVVFVDTSGEHFKHLYPYLSPTGEISGREIDFLRLLGRNLAGLVLLVDLARLWNPAATHPEEEEQVHILSWILVLLRWLRYRGEYDEGSRIRFQDHVNRQAMRLEKRLKIPVLALFSRADELTGLAVPRRPGPSWLRQDEEPKRALFPAGERPHLVAYHCLPELYRALLTHADHFRFDFVHSLVTDRRTGEVIDTAACGVSDSLAWLLEPSWRWPAIPTRVWLRLERLVDDRIRRNGRWRQLPDPEEVD